MKFLEILKYLFLAAFFAALVLTTYGITRARFNHPWMTETEILIYLPRIIAGETIPYEEARPR